MSTHFLSYHYSIPVVVYKLEIVGLLSNVPTHSSARTTIDNLSCGVGSFQKWEHSAMNVY